MSEFQISLGENGDEGEGQQQLQDVQQLLHSSAQFLEGPSNSLSELLIQHRLLLLLLQEVT